MLGKKSKKKKRKRKRKQELEFSRKEVIGLLSSLDKVDGYSVKGWYMVPAKWLRRIYMRRDIGDTPSMPLSELFVDGSHIRVDLKRCKAKHEFVTKPGAKMIDAPCEQISVLRFDKDGDYVVVSRRTFELLVKVFGTDTDLDPIVRHFPYVYSPTDIPQPAAELLLDKVKNMQRVIRAFFEQRGFASWDVSYDRVQLIMYRELLGSRDMKRAFRTHLSETQLHAWCLFHDRLVVVRAALASKRKKLFKRVRAFYGRGSLLYEAIDEGDLLVVKTMWMEKDQEYALETVDEPGYKHRSIREFIHSKEDITLSDTEMSSYSSSDS
jgi:hypothetical protein